MSTRRVYIICPVRDCTVGDREKLDWYVEQLEKKGCHVHYPHRDVNQSNDDGGVRICSEHREAMFDCNEVHVLWNGKSQGSHFDLGMAYMMNRFLLAVGVPPMKIYSVDVLERTDYKSFTNVLKAMCNNG